MDIKPTDNSINRDAATAAVATNANQARSGAPQRDAGGSLDQVTLTDTVAQLIELQESLAKVPDVNNEQVDAIRQALADGLYDLDTAKLAENLVKSELE